MTKQEYINKIQTYPSDKVLCNIHLPNHIDPFTITAKLAIEILEDNNEDSLSNMLLDIFNTSKILTNKEFLYKI